MTRNVISLAAKRREFAMLKFVRILQSTEPGEAVVLLNDFADHVERLALSLGPSDTRQPAEDP